MNSCCLSAKTPFNAAFLLVAGFLFIAVAVGCQTDSDYHAGDSPPLIVSTTGMIHDLVVHIGAEDVRARALMGPGVDPHLYRATPADFRNMERAAAIFFNGLYLEGRLSEILETKTGKAHRVTRSIPTTRLLRTSDEAETFDPHVWLDASLWRYAAMDVAEVLVELLPEKRKQLLQRRDRYIAQLDSLHAFTLHKMSRLKENGYTLVTSHDAFGYFGRAYNVNVRALQGLTTSSEIGIRDVSMLAQWVISEDIPVLFTEKGISTRGIESVVAGVRRRGGHVRIAGPLYSDSMGPAHTPQGTYIGMFSHNVHLIVQELAPDSVQTHHELYSSHIFDPVVSQLDFSALAKAAQRSACEISLSL